jgi:hypothetical protein
MFSKAQLSALPNDRMAYPLYEPINDGGATAPVITPDRWPSCSHLAQQNAPAIVFQRALDLRDQGESLWISRLRRVAFFEASGDMVERPVMPFLGFGQQLPAILGMKRGSLTVQRFHSAAVNEILHRHLPGSVDDILTPALSRCHYDFATGRLP